MNRVVGLMIFAIIGSLSVLVEANATSEKTVKSVLKEPEQKTKEKINENEDKNEDKLEIPKFVLKPESETQRERLTQYCYEELSQLPEKSHHKRLKAACQKVQQLEGCESHEKRPIFHYDRIGYYKRGTRVLALGVIHGDESPGGSLARAWIERLERINPRNHWRVVPILNPDGLKRGTRTNAKGVDLNRNYPSTDWKKLAHQYWRDKTKSSPRRYPGPAPASESETQCAIKHIKDFKPNLIVSIHTPLGVMDFDGPRLRFPKGSPLPWSRLGTFPGSLGRYMWRDHRLPVLTIELKGNVAIKSLEKLDRLQDVSGLVAIMNRKRQKAH